MQENKKKTAGPNQPARKTKKEREAEMRKIKTLVSFLCVICIFFLCYGHKIATFTQTQVKYNDFIVVLEEGKVEKADVNSTSGKLTYHLFDDDTTYYTNYPYSEGFVEMLLVNNVDVEIHETSWLTVAIKYGSLPIMMIFMFFLMTSMTKIGLSEFEIEPVESIKTRFSDVAGMDEIKEDMLLLSNMMKNPEYRKSGARIPRGVLLQGPPGNGKTLLARAFAGETGVNFIAVNACDFGSQFVGIGSSKIKKVFQAARKNAPCVIFIDEIDSVGAKRGTASDAAGKEMNTMLTSLLNQMDGFDKMDNVMVLAATNRASDLDEALIRPGRFDRQFVVAPPDKKARKELFTLYSRGKNIDTNVDFDILSNKTFGYSASKIECIVNEAIILSIKEKHEKVMMEDFENAIIQMDIKGHVKKESSHSAEERKIVAYHEAGHAIIAHFQSNKIVSSVTIKPTTSGAGGFTLTEDKDESGLKPINDYRNQLIMLYGGRAAEVELKGSIQQATAGASQDIKQATQIAASYVSIEQGIDYTAYGELGMKQIMSLSEELLKNVWFEAQTIISDKWEYVEAVAQELLRTETVSKEKFLEIISTINANKATHETPFLDDGELL